MSLPPYLRESELPYEILGKLPPEWQEAGKRLLATARAGLADSERLDWAFGNGELTLQRLVGQYNWAEATPTLIRAAIDLDRSAPRSGHGAKTDG